MRKHFTKSLTVIFAVLGVYFVAFKVLMRVDISVEWLPGHRLYYTSGAFCRFVHYEPRWGAYSSARGDAMRSFFAPLIWMESRVGWNNYREWNETEIGPEPDWVKEYLSKP